MSPHAHLAIVSGAERLSLEQSKSREAGRFWRNGVIAGLELFHGNFLNYAFTRHSHSVIAFGALEAGVMRSWHRESTYTVGPGTVLMFNPGEVHAPCPANSKRWSFRMFYLQEKLLEQLYGPLSAGNLRFSTPFSLDPNLGRRILSLHRELEGTIERIEFDCRLLEIFENVAQRYAEKDKVTPTNAAPQAVSRMREYIHAHAHDEVSLQTLADVARLSTYHALRSFRGTLGLPPHKYLLQVRIERAKVLLQSGHAIADVAANMGFADQSHLTRHFKRIFGVPPAHSLRVVS